MFATFSSCSFEGGLLLTLTSPWNSCEASGGLPFASAGVFAMVFRIATLAL